MCRGLDEQVELFRARPLEGEYPYLWLDAKVERGRERGGVRQKALVIAYAVHESGVREVLGIDVGEAETEAFWTEFLFSLKARGLAGVRLCVSDAHQGLKVAIARVLGCCWQRCTVHFLRDMLGHCGRSQQPMIATAIRQIFNADTGQEARERLADVVDRLKAPAPKVAGLLEEAEEELLAFYDFPREHWTKLRSTNPLERVNKEIGRRSDVVGIYPQRPGADPPRRHAPDRTERRVARPTPLPLRPLHPPRSLSARRYRTSSLEQQHHRGGRHPQRRLRPERPNDDHQLHHKTRLESRRSVTTCRGSRGELL
jgi:transposase-like protein